MTKPNFVITCLLFFISFISLFASDSPCSATILDTSTPQFDTYSNAGNSDSGVEIPPFGGYTGADAWFSFIMPAGGVNLIIASGGMIDPALGIYAGPCSNPILLYNVLDDNCDGSASPKMFLDQLIPGNEYFIRMWGQDGSGDGTFSIFINNTANEAPEFIVHSSASNQGDCIQLTPDATHQQGCAWFEIPLDFALPFSNTMTANFGNKDATGADGITLVYQSNGPDYCGSSGQGIGAEGMPNSAIFEFDTWQNGGLSDPPQDHTSFNVNGNMNHTNSINGPFILPNIEDGLDHDIQFNWDGVSGYELYFDGALVLSGSYDIINNCFGGSNTAWWGYTASTGGSTNLQKICPEVVDFELGTQEYQEFIICDGESANGYTESGFYIDLINSGNCLHQINTNVIVNPIPAPVFIDTTICKGDVINIAGFPIWQENFYEFTTNTLLGCDSVINVNLTVIESTIGVLPVANISCKDTELLLQSVFTTDTPDGVETYLWLGPQGSSNETEWLIDMPGIYTLDIILSAENVTCEYRTDITVGIDTLAPIINGLSDIQLDCDTANNIKSFDLSQSQPNGLLFAWQYQDSLIGDKSNQDLKGPGVYTVEITDPMNGCRTIDSAEVKLSDDTPKVDIKGNKLDCALDSFIFETTIDQSDVQVEWFKDNVFFSSEIQPIVKEPGIYKIVVVNSKGCQNSVNYPVIQDIVKPIVDIADGTILCNLDEVVVSALIDTTYILDWLNLAPISVDSNMLIFSDEGKYYFNLFDPSNSCTSTDSITISDLGDSPTLDISPDILTCSKPDFELLTSVDQPEVTYEWSVNGLFLSNYQNPTIFEPGLYYVTATSLTGCQTFDSIEIAIDTIPPTIDFGVQDSIKCDQLMVAIDASIQNANQFIWTGPEDFIDSTQTPNVGFPGTYNIVSTSTSNGCITQASIEIISTIVIPIYELADDTLNCFIPIKSLAFDIDTPYEGISWEGPNGFSSKELNPDVDQFGLYKLHIDVEGDCDIDTSLYINGDFEKPTLEKSFNDITCKTPFSQISVQPSDLLSDFYWTTPYGSESSLDFSTNESGKYTIELIGLNGCGTIDSFSINEFLDKPVFDLLPDGIISCKNTMVTITSQSIESDLIYDWIGQNISLPTLSVDAGGQYALSVINQYGCSDTMQVLIEEDLSLPELFIMGNDIDCFDPIAILTLTSSDTLENLQWSTPSGYTGDMSTPIISSPISGQYIVTASGQNGCNNEVSFDVANLKIYPNIELISPDTTIIDEDMVEGSLEVNIISLIDYDLQWVPSQGLSCDDCLNPMILEDYQLQYTLYAVNKYGCESEIQAHIREKIKPVKIHIPNIISVNGDDNNSGFTLYGKEDKIEHISSLSIFDRWGNKVFNGIELPINDASKGWKGKNNGRLVEQGVYVYHGIVLLKDGKSLKFAGDVTVVR